jgi:VanZ family protein
MNYLGRRGVLSLWGPVVLYAGLIFLLSSLSSIPFEVNNFSHFDKVSHVTEYGLFCFLVFRAFRGTYPGAPFFTIALWTFLISVAYGALDEFHQYFVPQRDSDIFDLMADGTGALSVLSILFLVERRLRWSHSSGGKVDRLKAEG